MVSKLRGYVALWSQATSHQSRHHAEGHPGRKLRVEERGGDYEYVPQKLRTHWRACCLGFTKIFAQRKTHIPVACAFMHLASLGLFCLEGEIDFIGGGSDGPSGSWEQILSMGGKHIGSAARRLPAEDLL